MQLDNPYFFAAYEQRLLLRQQTEAYNTLQNEVAFAIENSGLDDTIQNYQNYQIQFDNSPDDYKPS